MTPSSRFNSVVKNNGNNFKSSVKEKESVLKNCKTSSVSVKDSGVLRRSSSKERDRQLNEKEISLSS